MYPSQQLPATVLDLMGHGVATGLGLNPHGNLQGGPVIFTLQVRRQRLRQMKGLLGPSARGGHKDLRL